MAEFISRLPAQGSEPQIQEPPSWDEIKSSDEYKGLSYPEQLNLAKQWGDETKAYASTLPEYSPEQDAQIDEFVGTKAVDVPTDVRMAAGAAGLVKGAAAGMGAIIGGATGLLTGPAAPVAVPALGVAGAIGMEKLAEKGLETFTPKALEAQKYAPTEAKIGQIVPEVLTAGASGYGIVKAGKTLFSELGARKAAEELGKSLGKGAGVGVGVGLMARGATGGEITPGTIATDALLGALYTGLGSGSRVKGYNRDEAIALNERVKSGKATETEFRDWNGILAEAQKTGAKGVEAVKRTTVELGGKPVFDKTELSGGMPTSTKPYYEPLPSPTSREIQVAARPVEEPAMKRAMPAQYEQLPEVGVRGAVRGTQADTAEMQRRGIITPMQESLVNLDEPTPRTKIFSIESQGINKQAIAPTPETIITPPAPGPMEGELVREGAIITPRTQLPTTQRQALPAKAEVVETPQPAAPAAQVGQPIPRPMGGREGEAGFVSTDLKKILKNYMTSAGALTDDMAETLLASRYNKAQLGYEAKFRFRDFNKALIEETGSSKISPELMKAVREYINGQSENVSAIPPKTLEAAKRFRSFLDQGSRKLLNEPGLLTEKQRQTVEANVGSYFSRSYKKFYDPNFTMDKLEAKDKEKFAKMVDFVRRQFLDRAKQEVDDATESGRPPIEWLRKVNETQSVPRERLMGEVQRIVEEGGAAEARRLGKKMEFRTESYGISKELSGLKARKDIPEEIRYLMGEDDDPRVGFLKSALKQINLYVDQRTLSKLKEQGFEAGLFYDYPAPNTVEIAPTDSKVMSPLNGVYAAPDVANALKNFDVAFNSTIPGVTTFARINSVIKWSKTVGSIRSQARNFIFNIPIQVQNGNFDFLAGKDFGKTTSIIMADYGIGQDTQQTRQLLRRAVGLGVMNNAKFNEMEAIMKDAAIDRGDIQNFVERHFYKYAEKPLTRAIDSVAAIKDFFDFMYRTGDNFHKIALWRYRVRALMDGKKMNEADAEIEAAGWVNDRFATYEKLGPVLKAFRANPFTKNFISWNAERIRNSYHSIKGGIEDMRTPGMEKYGMRTIIGNILGLTISLGSQIMSAYALGWTYQKIKELNSLAPNYQKAATLLPIGYDPKNKEITYIDISYSDPFDIIRQPINAFMSEDALDKKLISAIGTFFGDFLGVSIATEVAAGILKNERADGTQIVNPKASPAAKLQGYAEYAGRVIEPGTISDMRQMYYAIKGQPDPFFGPRAPVPSIGGMASSAAGFRVQKLNVGDELFKKSRSFNNAMGQSTRLLTGELMARGNPSAERLKAGAEEMDRARIDTFKDMRKIYKAALSWGLSDSEAMSEMKRGGISRENIAAITTGKVPRYAVGRTMMKELYRDVPEDYQRRMDITRELLQEQQ